MVELVGSAMSTVFGARSNQGRSSQQTLREGSICRSGASVPDRGDLDGVRPGLECLPDGGVELGHLGHAFLERSLAAGVALVRAQLESEPVGDVDLGQHDAAEDAVVVILVLCLD